MRSVKQVYMNNPALPVVGAEFEYTPEMVKELEKCGKNLLYFAETYFFIISLDEGRQKINLHTCQKRVIRKMRDSRFFILLASRQIGKSTLLTIYALWCACFFKDQSILIVANKESTASEIFRRIRLAYEELPNWLKPGVKEYGKTSMELGNGSRIGISTTTGTAARGQSINVLILDELGHIEPNLASSFWASVYPIVSSSKKSKILVASTANGTGNLFYTLYKGAEEGTNGWEYDRVLWNEVPGRDEKWRRQTVATLGSEEAFQQEFNCVFQAAGQSSIDDDLFDKLNMLIRQPKYLMDEGFYQIWEQPEDNKIYVAGVDTGEGVGQDSSVVNIFDISDLTNIKQVACYANNKISPFQFTEKVNEILTQWGKPLVCIERNAVGAQVVDNLRNIHNYENIVSWGSSAASRERDMLGVISHTNTKFTGVTNMRYWLNELQVVQIRDIHLLKELKNFVRHANGTWSARKEPGNHDDRVMSMVWALLILAEDVVSKHFEILKLDQNNKPLLIKQLDFGIKYFTSTNVFQDQREKSGSLNVSPFIIGGINQVSDEVHELMEAGWKPYDNSSRS